MRYKDLSDLSTNPEEIKWLGSPEHQEYQECWRKFHQRYHHAILQYIMRVAGWGKDNLDEAEEIVSRVYEKGFRWSFRRPIQIKFRIILKRLVKDVLHDYWKSRGKIPIPLEIQDNEYTDDWFSYSFSVEILETIIQNILKNFPEKEQKVLSAIWEADGVWPNSHDLANILGCSRDAARKWKERRKELWQNFQQQLIEEIKFLVWGERKQEEINYFSQLELDMEE